MLMDILIPAAGLVVIFCGVGLAWYQRGIHTLSTLVTGITLVAIGGPIANRLSVLSISEKGLNINLEKASPREVLTSSVRAEIAESISAATLPTIKGKEGTSAQSGFGEEYVNYFQSLGFVPAQVGSDVGELGTIIRITSDGSRVLVARPADAFYDLKVVTLPIVLPKKDFRSEVGTGPTKTQRMATFDCKNPSTEALSRIELQMKLKPTIIQFLSQTSTEGLYVVSQIIKCEQLSIAVEDRMETTPSKTDFSAQYQSDKTVVVAYTLERIVLTSPKS
jgi:hypothetical protein